MAIGSTGPVAIHLHLSVGQTSVLCTHLPYEDAFTNPSITQQSGFFTLGANNLQGLPEALGSIKVLNKYWA